MKLDDLDEKMIEYLHCFIQRYKLTIVDKPKKYYPFLKNSWQDIKDIIKDKHKY